MDPKTYDMCDDRYDADEALAERDYADFVKWLENKAISDLKAAPGNRAKMREALLRYFSIGYKANLTPSELWDYLSISSNHILERAGLSEDDFDWALEIVSDSSFNPSDYALSEADYVASKAPARRRKPKEESPFWNPGSTGYSNFHPQSRVFVVDLDTYLCNVVFNTALTQKQCIDCWPDVDEEFSAALAFTFAAEDITAAADQLRPKIITWRNAGGFKSYQAAVDIADPDFDRKIAELEKKGGVAATAVITGIDKSKIEIESPLDPFYVWALKVATRLFISNASEHSFQRFNDDYFKYLSGSSEFRIVRLAEQLSQFVEDGKEMNWVSEERRNLSRLLKQASLKVGAGYASYRHIRPVPKAAAVLAEYSKKVEAMVAK